VSLYAVNDLDVFSDTILKPYQTCEQVAQHASEDDAWTVFRGRVYNITPYLHYHPGGVEILMKGAGKDCTELFDLYHKWVNAEGMVSE
jgi:cytochrome b involved in lipid metabolism